MSSFLTSQEDITPYIQQLSKINKNAMNEMERRRSFAADPESIIKELLTEVMSCRNYLKQATSIAEKFLEAYNICKEDLEKMNSKTVNLYEEIEELTAKNQKMQKEFEIKENRYESIALEATEMERALKMLNNDCTQLKKERDFLKKEIAQREQTNIIKENTLQQRQKIHIEIEKEKEKEVDKALISKCEGLLADVKKKQAEIEELNGRLKESEGLFVVEKGNNDKIKGALQVLKNETTVQKIEIEKYLNKNIALKERLKECEQELVQVKSLNESLIKEYERQKSGNFTGLQRESTEITEEALKSFSIKGENKPENFGNFLQELELSDSQPVDPPFFIISPSTNQSTPSYFLTQTKKICFGHSFNIVPKVSCVSLKTFKIFNVDMRLSIEKNETISVIKVENFNFDDANSVESNETETSIKGRKASVVENRDPIKEFFIFVLFI